MKKLLFSFISLIIIINSYSQEENIKNKFEEGNFLLESKLYQLALPIWKELLKADTSNANYNYKIGFTYLHSYKHKEKALPYLKRAIKKVSPAYDPFYYKENKAPIESYYYYAKALHLNYKLDEAIKYYAKFMSMVTKKHNLFKLAERGIETASNAKEFMAAPVKILVENLSCSLNSEYPDYSPVISLDENVLYFTSRRLRPDSSNLNDKAPDDGMYFEDIYVSYKINDKWGKPELLNICTPGHEATLNLSADGQTLLIYRDDNGNGNIYQSHLIDAEFWSEPEPLGSNINTKYIESHAALSPDNEILYFVSDRPGGEGGRDIYFCKKLPTGEWALAQNIGKTINTEYDERGVFIHPDGKTIFFSSQGHKSMGGFDIFFSVMDENGKWLPPQNMGYPINGTDDDVFLVVSADGKRAYYSSFKEDGCGEKDIYRITLEQFVEKPLALLKGKFIVPGKEKIPSDVEVVVTDNENGELIGIYRPLKRTGTFTIIIPPGSTYHIEYTSDEYDFYKEEDLYVPELSSYKEIERAIDLKPVELPSKKELAENIEKKKEEKENKKENVKINAVEYKKTFAYNVSEIEYDDADFQKFIDKIMNEIYSKTNELNVEIEASASRVPTRAYSSNQELAELRAQNAKKALIKALNERKVNEDKIHFINIQSTVQGPMYKNDFVKNRAVYEKYQYSKIIVK